MPYKNYANLLARQKVYRDKPEVKVRRRDFQRAWMQRKRLEAERLFGRICVLCNKESPSSDNLPKGKVAFKIVYHEKNLKRHNGSIMYALKHREDFVPLCKLCHDTVHRMNVLFGLEWKDILSMRERWKEVGG